MEYYWTMLNNNISSTSNSNSLRGHNGNFTNNHAWESSDLHSSSSNSSSSRVDWSSPLHHSLNYTPSAAAGSELHALMLHQQEENRAHYHKPDPHLMCLKLGKRHYFENVSSAPVIGERHVAAAMAKKGKSCREIVGGPSAPRCQVEGCEVVLVNAKDYHRRHKVCEMHAKAPRVVVLGIEQRFCQQCSRFHGVGEFDESKRSCRRRLAGHNERRRKSSQDHSLPRKSSQDIKMMSAGRPPHYLNSSECALSLLSSTNNIPWNIPAASADLPARCSAALHELIAENRASILAYRQQLNSNQMQDHFNNHKNNDSIRAGSNPRFFNLHENNGHVTLDLMQDPNSAFGLLSVHDHKSSKEGGGEEDCSELWKFPLGY